ncbi:trimethylamine-N-oxide reductase TorA [Helicobacter monodelphidis]|uniref:molybdopterin guanine dinucleotide-containing S/N-oxide reductase n=1 Tax=Helicobacter sp. 15-1451 TaxID=2004995 RepID=UPI000DCBBC6A|nr:molybdopterin guanine dinucleotide-containing S/N-oxide reductase [Helicobacter sp. 15-1451]RAX56572.1 trimethylamine-N-oxide reductase TorA [Helicobacter sp. 15-1451]
MKNSNITRRNILKAVAVFAAIPFVDMVSRRSALFAAGIEKFSTELVKDGEVVSGAHWGILKHTIKNGKVVSSQNAMKSSVKNPFHSATADLIYTQSRIKYPMVRKSYLENPKNPKPELRGADEWVKVSYQDAIKLIAQELKATYKQKGAEGIFAGSYGWKSSGNMHNSRILLHRFMGMAGGYVGTTGDYSTGASQVIMAHVMGNLEVYDQQTSWDVVLESSEVVVIWGADPLVTLRIAWSVNDGQGLEYLEKLKKSKKKIICIDPIRNDTCQYLNGEWVAPIPNTDTALMLGIMHTMLVSGQYDKEFVANYTYGFNDFSAYVLGKKDKIVKDAKWASEICGISEKTIREFAELFYKKRTMLLSGWGMQRAHHGEQPHWMMVALACMIGQIGLPGGGFGLSYHYSNGGAPTATAGVIGGMSIGSSASGAAEWLVQGAKYSFPVARIAEALLNPGKTIDDNGKKVTYTDIDLIYWAGGNPVTQHQNINEFLKAWKKPRTIIVHEPYWTPTAKFADIVMPITTSYERNDISMSGDYSNLNIVPMKALVAKEGESVDDYQVFSDLARELGFFEQYTEGKNEMQWIEQFYNQAYKQYTAMIERAKELAIEMPPFKEFWKKNQPLTFLVPAENQSWVRHADFREDPILSPLGTPSGLIELYSNVIEKMKYDDCRAYPSWFEPVEWLGMKNKPAEFALLTNHPQYRLHSQLANTSLREKNAISGREPIWINTKDAKKKGIKQGDIVRVFNARGQVLAGAYVTDNIKEGVVKLSEGAWYDPQNPKEPNSLCKNGCANVLTIDIPTSKLANGNISHTGLVNIEKYTQKPAEVTAFTPPKVG